MTCAGVQTKYRVDTHEQYQIENKVCFDFSLQIRLKTKPVFKNTCSKLMKMYFKSRQTKITR